MLSPHVLYLRSAGDNLGRPAVHRPGMLPCGECALLWVPCVYGDTLLTALVLASRVGEVAVAKRDRAGECGVTLSSESTGRSPAGPTLQRLPDPPPPASVFV